MPRLGARHNLYTRISKSTGRLLLVLEHELHEVFESEITFELLEALVNKLGQELTDANTAIVTLKKSNDTKDATITARDATITDLQKQLDVANAKDAANPLNDPETATAAATLATTLAGLPADVLPPAPAPTPTPADTLPATGA